ncbi:MAG: hypothetical protein FD123_480 [Bacteroidetes bacterium]|nr:MAG: hypothetical protein FD123_480 [Bacteroidota bacterium]
MHMKLLTNIITRLTESPRAAGLEVFSGPGGYVFHLVVLQKKGGKVIIETKQENIPGTDALKKQIRPGMPVYLALTGRGLVHKKVSAAASDDARTLLPKVLPNAAPGDFYMQRVNGLNGQAFVSIVRRQTLDPLLEELKPVCDIVSCSLGALPVAGIAALFEKNEYQFEIEASGQKLVFSNGELGDLQAPETGTNENHKISGEDLPAVLLTAFAAGFGHFSGAGIAADVDSLLRGSEEYRQKRLFKAGAGTVLVFILVVLLGNYFAFQHYWDKKAKLETQLALSGGELQRYQALEKNLSEKQQFLESSGLLLASKTSYYADQLAADLPATITFTRLNIAPKQHLNTTDSIAFRPGIVFAEGLCRQSVELNNWIRLLKEKTWIKNVSLQSYNQAKGEERGEFSLQIDIN